MTIHEMSTQHMWMPSSLCPFRNIAMNNNHHFTWCIASSLQLKHFVTQLMACRTKSMMNNSQKYTLKLHLNAILTNDNRVDYNYFTVHLMRFFLITITILFYFRYYYSPSQRTVKSLRGCVQFMLPFLFDASLTSQVFDSIGAISKNSRMHLKPIGLWSKALWFHVEFILGAFHFWCIDWCLVSTIRHAISELKKKWASKMARKVRRGSIEWTVR